MKKTAIALLLLLLVIPVSALELKALLAIHSNRYISSSEIETFTWQKKSGVAFGVGCGYALAPHLQIEANALLCKKGAKTTLLHEKGMESVGDYSASVLAIPLFFQYRLKEGATPYAAIGPEFNFILSHSLTIDKRLPPIDISRETKRMVFGLNIAFGYSLPLGRFGVQAEARYNRWLSDLWKSPDAAVKNQTLSFLIGGVYFL